jgi:hypothetical protein
MGRPLSALAAAPSDGASDVAEAGGTDSWDDLPRVGKNDGLTGPNLRAWRTVLCRFGRNVRNAWLRRCPWAYASSSWTFSVSIVSVPPPLAQRQLSGRQFDPLSARYWAACCPIVRSEPATRSKSQGEPSNE